MPHLRILPEQLFAISVKPTLVALLLHQHLIVLDELGGQLSSPLFDMVFEELAFLLNIETGVVFVVEHCPSQVVGVALNVEAHHI